MDIAVIGAGPVGSYYASLAKEDIGLFEEHKKIGEPVQCTGIFTSEILRFIPKELVLNRLDVLRLVSPSGYVKEVNVKDNIVCNRTELDKYFFDKALDASVTAYLGYKFEKFNGKEVNFGKKKFLADKLVGADGAVSNVARTCGLWQGRKFMFGKQASVKGKFRDNVFQVNLGIVPGGFGWVVPESSSIARVGVMGYSNINSVFNKFVKGSVIEYNAGLIPIYKKIRLVRRNVALIGDAGLMVKAFSGGGVVQGLRAAEELANGFKGYEKRVEKKVGKELKRNLMIRKFLDKLSFKDYDYLIKNIDCLEELERDSGFKAGFILKNWKLLLFGLKKSVF